MLLQTIKLILAGPIVRITPEEIHIDDIDFWDTLYAKHPKSQKYSWMNGRFGNESSIFTTCDPVHHRQRRAPLSRMQVFPLPISCMETIADLGLTGFQGEQ